MNSELLNQNVQNLDPSMFEFVQKEKVITDTKMSTKRIGYFKDALIRFTHNKASVVAFAIILLLFLFAIVIPFTSSTNYTKSRNDLNAKYYAQLLPKMFETGTGFMDGTRVDEIKIDKYYQYMAIGEETGRNPVVEIKDEFQFQGVTYYKASIDYYARLGVQTMTLTKEDYYAMQRYQDENNVQLIYPATDEKKVVAQMLQSNKNSVNNIWYEHNAKGMPVLTNGKLVDIYLKGSNGATKDDEYFSTMRIAADDGTYKYAILGGTDEAPQYIVRVSLYEYFVYKYGIEPQFAFGTDKSGLDILTRLASGARLSFILAFFVATINLIIGAIWGSISGYFGGTTDLVMERITDILGNVPFMVVTTLFQLHLASKVGPFVSLLFAFVTTGWIGTASTVRMQFYRYKHQEYILAARTLGAKNSRLMYKHIFPNALGTIITSSVLVIPGVIFSESSLTYLGIVNLESDSITSVGTMLANGRDKLQDFPHIILFPALFISLLMITFNLFGNGLRDAFNPSLRGSED